MIKTLTTIMLCVGVGYVAYPYIHKARENSGPQFNILLLSSVPKNEVVGSWVLSPSSTSMVSSQITLSGRRTGLSLESWGGGNASFCIGQAELDGPISWELQPGLQGEPAALKVTSGKDDIVFKFSKLGDRTVLVAEGDSVVPGLKNYLRLIKAD